MTQEEIQLTFLRGILSECTPEERARFDAAKRDLDNALAAHSPDIGALALSMATLERIIADQKKGEA